MLNKYLHESFYGFYPSELFDFGENNKRIQELEYKSRKLSDLLELKSLYMKSMSASLYRDDIINQCEYAKQLIKMSNDDIKVFVKNNQRTATELFSLYSLFISVMALGASAFGVANYLFYYLLFGVIAVVGACYSYVHSVNTRTLNSKQVEKYRQMLMCFETVEEMARETRKS